jgi:glyoxylase-like metal-dependent hydrolase (beta-lactamase superfamily II)
LNSHNHLDHICNNDLIQAVAAREKAHFLSEAGLPGLDAPGAFADLFLRMEELFDPLTGYQANRLKFRLVGAMRDLAYLFIDRQRVWRFFMSITLAKFNPVHDSRETIRAYETLPRQELKIGDETWSGWVLGDDDVWVLEERGHTPDEVLFYIPEHRLLHTADMTFPLFPTWPDGDGARVRNMLHRCLAIVQAGDVAILTDSHHHQIYRGGSDISTFLETILSDHERFREILAAILQEQDGLTVGEVYARLKERPPEQVVEKYLDIEFPHSPPSLQNVMASSLLEMGYKARGPRRHKRFYRPKGSEA